MDGKLYPKRSELSLHGVAELDEWEKVSSKPAVMARNRSFRNFKETIY
jgi:hypothetical protein